MGKVKVPIFPHIQSWDAPWLPTFYQKLRDSGASGELWCKGVDPPKDRPTWASDVLMVCRGFEDDAISWADMAAGKDGAVNFFNRWAKFWDERRWCHAFTTGNEPHPPWDVEFLKRLNEFTVSLAALMAVEGFNSVVLNFSVGWPDVGMAKYVGDAAEAGTYVCLHEYSAPAMWTNETWHCLRYRRTYQEWADAGYHNVAPLLIGENGIDGGVEPVWRPKTGWKEFCVVDGTLQESEYTLQLKWYGEQLVKDNVAASFVFTECNWDWFSFDWTDELARQVGDMAAAGIDVDEPVDPEPVPPGAIYIVPDLPVHPTKTYNTRAIGDIDMVVVHHSGYSYPADASQEQVELHCQRIAEYHIEENDWPGIAYHYIVDGSGRVYQVNNLSTISYHAGATYNPRSVGVCMLGAFHLEVDPTDAQLEAVHKIYKWLGFTGEQVKPHKALVATACPGKVSRWWDKIVYDDPEEPENPEEDDDMVDVINMDGDTIMTWDQAREAYNIDVVRCDPPEGVVAYRLKEIQLHNTGESTWRIYVRDENGAPVPGVACLLGILPDSGQDLPPDAAPILGQNGVHAQPDGYPNRALVLSPNDLNFTNQDGFVEQALGPGSNYVPPALGGSGTGTHWTWAMGQHSDVVTGIGMWDNHNTWWITLEQYTVGEGEPVDPEPETGDYEILVPEINITIPAFRMVARKVVE